MMRKMKQTGVQAAHNQPGGMDAARTLVLACATVIEEMKPLMPSGMAQQVFDFGLHVNPASLRQTLQETIASAGRDYDTILLGYGMCAQALVGIRAAGCRLVAPRVDDCIALFLGSARAYQAQTRAEPGTYYLTKGWIEAGDTPFSDYDRHVQKYGAERAGQIYHAMMGKYKRLAFINTGQVHLAKYRRYARSTARRFGLRYEEVQGSDTLIRRLLYGPWDEDFVVIEPGGTFQLCDFLPTCTGAA